MFLFVLGRASTSHLRSSASRPHVPTTTGTELRRGALLIARRASVAAASIGAPSRLRELVGFPHDLAQTTPNQCGIEAADEGRNPGTWAISRIVRRSSPVRSISTRRRSLVRAQYRPLSSWLQQAESRRGCSDLLAWSIRPMRGLARDTGGGSPGRACRRSACRQGPASGGVELERLVALGHAVLEIALGEARLHGPEEALQTQDAGFREGS